MEKKVTMTSQIGSRSRGLTLVEILVAVAILATGGVLILQALARGAYALNVAENRRWAYVFSQAKMADLDMSLKQGLEPKTHGEFRMGREQFRWDVDTFATDEPELQLVTLTVAWRQGRHDYASQFSTLVRVEVEEEVL